MDLGVQGEETFEVFGYVSSHESVDILLVIIPFHVKSTVVLSFNVHGYFSYFKIEFKR